MPFHGRATGRNCSVFSGCIRSRPGSSSLEGPYATDAAFNRKELLSVAVLPSFPQWEQFLTRLLCFAISGVNVILLGPIPSSG